MSIDNQTPNGLSFSFTTDQKIIRTCNYGSTNFSNKVALTKFIGACCIFIDKKLKKLKEEESLIFGPTGTAK